MVLSRNSIREEQAIDVSVQDLSRTVPEERTAISETSGRETAMYNCDDRWCGDSSEHGVGWLVHILYDKYTKKSAPMLNLLKSQYQFHDETNKDILHDREVERFAILYNLTNVCPVLSSNDTYFWLKDPDGVIYLWSRTDELMIYGGCDMKEALINFLFHRENLYYINEYTHEFISVKKVKEEAIEWYREVKGTEIVINVDELLKPLKNEKKGSKKR